jgi:vacuolar-type H+-ATPase subunit E/Vma4
MPFEDLIKAVQTSAEERIREIRERARTEAEEILNEARSKEEGIKRNSMEVAKHTIELDKIRQIAALQEETKMQLAKKKDELFQRSFEATQEKLEAARREPAYPNIFQRFLMEALQERPEGEGVIHIDPRDELICKNILAELKMNSQVVVDLHSMGGLSITSSDQTISILNTLESRLEMAKEQLRAEVFSILFGE